MVRFLVLRMRGYSWDFCPRKHCCPLSYFDRIQLVVLNFFLRLVRGFSSMAGLALAPSRVYKRVTFILRQFARIFKNCSFRDTYSSEDCRNTSRTRLFLRGWLEEIVEKDNYDYRIVILVTNRSKFITDRAIGRKFTRNMVSILSRYGYRRSKRT